MILTLKRLKDGDEEATTGDLWAEDDHWFTLEPAQPIPTGLYEVRITPSPRFKRPLPLLIDVPGHDGIRIHPGNSSVDTTGCILLGDSLDREDWIGESNIAFERFFAWLQNALSLNPVYLDIGYAT